MLSSDGRVISNFIYKALKDEPIKIYGSGSKQGLFVMWMIWLMEWLLL